jgi:peptidoglycan/LPS O-acetylase OafA/YrhL
MLHCINGVRVISIVWVVLGHVFGNIPNFPTNNYFPYYLKVCFSDEKFRV